MGGQGLMNQFASTTDDKLAMIGLLQNNITLDIGYCCCFRRCYYCFCIAVIALYYF